MRLKKVAKLLIDAALDEARACETAERMARDVLSNPVIENYRVEVEG